MLNSIRLTLYTSIALFSQCLFAQEIRPSVFATLSGYRHTGFEDGLFVDFEVGIGAKSTFWITPEISYKHGGGDLNYQAIYQDGIQPLALDKELRVTFTSNLFGIGANIRLTKQEDFWLFFWPRYYGGNVRFDGVYTVGKENTQRAEIREKANTTRFESYLDFSLGYAGYLDDAERFKASIFLTYTTMQLKDGFESLEFEQTEILPASTGTNTLGLGFKIEYVLW